MMIGIIAAMAEEAAYLKDQMDELKISEIAGNIFYIGKIKDISIVLLQCGIGKVNAAIGTTLLIERFKPDYIINTGTAGGLQEALHVGDVVISLEVRHHDVDLTVFGYEHGQLPQLPSAFLPSQILVDAAEQAAIQLNMGVTKGMIISGDSFMHRDEEVARIRKQFNNPAAVEMEAAAVAQVCHLFQIPFVIIRAVSDLANKDSAASAEAHLEQASRNCAELILHMLEGLR